MNDPHVESLEYKLDTADTVSFNNPEPLEGDAGGFTYRLADGLLTLAMKGHYATRDEAVEAVRPFIRAWKLDQAVERGRREWWFTFVRCNITDRRPTPGVTALQAELGTSTIIGKDAPLTTAYRSYPKPPVDFMTSPELETLWMRYENQLLGGEYLPAMGYFCLTVIETVYGAVSPPQPPRTTGKRRRAAGAEQQRTSRNTGESRVR